MYKIRVKTLFEGTHHSIKDYASADEAESALDEMVLDGVYLNDFDESDVVSAEVVEV